MIAEAERNRAEDQRLRQEVDARNELDAVAYQVERRLAEPRRRGAGPRAGRAEMLVGDARQAIKEQAPLDRLRSLTGELQQVLQGLRRQPPQQGGAGRADPWGAGQVTTTSSTPTSPRLGDGRRERPAPAPRRDEDRPTRAEAAEPRRRRRRGAGPSSRTAGGGRLADLDNLRKRFERELARERAAERARVAAQWLPVVDNLDRALDHARRDPGSIVEGGAGGPRAGAGRPWPGSGSRASTDVGEPFDPARHEAVSVVETTRRRRARWSHVCGPATAPTEDILRPAAVVVDPPRPE